MSTDVTALRPAKVAPRLYWWKECLLIAGFYSIYTFSRNQFGSARLSSLGQPKQAFDNARDLIHLERTLGLFHEKAIQHAFLGADWFIRFWNVYYGTAHFIITIGLFIVMYHRARHMFTKWRNVILATTALALLGFSLMPVMPPRLLDSTSRYGGACLQIRDSGGTCSDAEMAAWDAQPDPGYGIHDTLAETGGLWSFDSGAMSKLSNQYAAMPSLHCGWATWCALVGWRLTRKKWLRAALVAYPILTLFCIIVTGNHYWIDGIGGLLTLGAGWLVGHYFDEWNDNRLERKMELTTADAG